MTSQFPSRLSRTLLCSGAGLAALLAAAPALAQGAANQASTQVEEVVVTAQRREEASQKIPVAVSTFTAKQVEQLNIGNTLQLTQYVPNLIGNNNTGLAAANTYYLRGLGTTESIATQDPPVGTYVDEIYISRQSANNFSLFNVERVEVLRGPQGTLFGRNTTGGAISVILKKPGQEFGGFVEGSVGKFNRRSARGSVDLPINDMVSTNLSAFYVKDDGYVKNSVTGEKLNGEESKGIRGAATLRFTDTTRWDLAGLYTNSKSANLINFLCDPANPTRCSDRYATTGVLINNGGANQFAPLVIANGKGNLPLGSETTLKMGSSNFQTEIGSTTVNLITGYLTTDQDYLLDFYDGRNVPIWSLAAGVGGQPSPYNIANNVQNLTAVRGFRFGGFTIANVARTIQFTQEIKAYGSAMDDRLKYVAGLYYIRESSSTDVADVIGFSGTPTLSADRVISNVTKATAAYAQFDYKLTDQISLTAGVRYTDEKKKFGFFDNRAICAVPAASLPATCLDTRNFGSVDVDLNPATPNIVIPLQQEAKLWTPRFAINWTPKDDLLIFASATRGFKSGSIAGRATSVRSTLPFRPEVVWSYETGFKSEWLDKRLRVNATAFYQETEDFQGGSAFVNPLTQALSFSTRNLAKLTNPGLELEVVAVPAAGLTLNMTAGFQKARYVIDQGAPLFDKYNFLSVAGQQKECLAALANQPSPRGDTRTAIARAGNCGNGIVRFDGQISKPVRSPDMTLSFGARYERFYEPLHAWITPAINLVYTGDEEVGAANTSAWRSASGVLNVARDGDFVSGSFSEAHTVLNASLTITDESKTWLGSIACDNCTNEAWPQSSFANYSYYNAPGTWSVRIKRKF